MDRQLVLAFLQFMFCLGVFIVCITDVEAREVKHLYIFGDSLSSPTGCEWSQVFRGDWAVHNYAQAGLTAEAMQIPSYLAPRYEDSVAVLGLGTNDIGSGTHPRDVMVHIRALYYKLRGVGFTNIIIMGIPYMALRDHPRSPEFYELDKSIWDFAYSQHKYAKYYKPIWSKSDTSDGIHPTCGANMFIGLSILQEIQS